MNQSELQVLKEQLAYTAEAMGKDLTPGGLKLFASDLSEYRLDDALEALRNCRRELSRFPTIADIVSRIEASDGRPGAEEAWAMIPKDEYQSAAITTEMQAAYAAAHPHLKLGDHVAGRMAFREVYERLVREARSKGEKPKWTASLGFDPAQRETAIAEADARNGESRKALPSPASPEIPVDPHAAEKIRALTAQIAKSVPGGET